MRCARLLGNDDVRGGLVFALLTALTLHFDRLMDLALGIPDWNEVLRLGLSWDHMVPYWRAMWVVYFPGLLLLFSLSCRSLIPLLWGGAAQLFGVHDLLYFWVHGIAIPDELVYLEETFAWSVATALGFGTLSRFALLVVSVVGVVVGALLTMIYLTLRLRYIPRLRHQVKGFIGRYKNAA